jgi:hypothetical protein
VNDSLPAWLAICGRQAGHPVFQPELLIAGQPQSVRDWLLHGESVQPVLDLIDVARWAVT